jgi:hypothetical protein
MKQIRRENVPRLIWEHFFLSTKINSRILFVGEGGSSFSYLFVFIAINYKYLLCLDLRSFIMVYFNARTRAALAMSY